MKKNVVVIACILLIVPLLFTSACNTVQAEKKDYPERYEELSSLLGEKRETVLARFNLTEQDLIQVSRGIYDTPLVAEYNGLTFGVRLGFTETNDILDGRMVAFYYRRRFDNQWNNAIHEVSALSKVLTQVFGEVQAKADGSTLIFSTASEAKLSQILAEKDMINRTNSWHVQRRDDPVIRSYLADILKVKAAPGPVSEDHLNQILTMRVAANKQYDAVLIELEFGLDFEFITQQNKT
ncbi:MAG: hypothetical protein J5794_02620 [Lachnospiraceae bacterium]|nr:hypothetical protein [Lachnospiraceae bacterium]